MKSRYSVHVFIAIALFSLVAALLYWPARNGVWTLDDAASIVHNPALRDFSESFRLLLQSRGVAFFSFALNAEAAGLAPAAFRWVNVAIHTLNALLVVLLLRQLTQMPWRWALLGGLFFLCHPVQTSAVSYIVQRMALLSAGFALGAILLADRYLLNCAAGERTGTSRYLALSLLCGILSVLSKENTVLLPLVIPVLAWLRGQGRLVAGWRPALALWLLIPLVAVAFQGVGGAIATQVVNSGGSPLYKETGQVFYSSLGDQELAYLPLRYFLSQLEVFWVYLQLVFLPLHQAFDYCWPLPEPGLTALQLGTLALFGVIGWFAWRRRDRHPLFLVGVVWIVLFAAVESSFIPLDPIFEHRLYLPVVGVLLCLYALLAPRLKGVATAIAIGVIVCLAFLSWQRNRLWGDPVRFWQESAQQAPRAPRALSHLANALFVQQRFAEAVTTIQKMGAMYNLGDMQLGAALYFAGREAEAMAAFRTAEERGDPGANGVELFSAHRALRAGRLNEAGEWLDKAERKWKRDVPSLYLRGLLAEAQNDVPAAISWYIRAVEEYAGADSLLFYTFNEAYARWAAERRTLLLGRLAAELEAERAGIEAAPQNLERRGTFANRLLNLGLYDEAIAHYRALIEVRPQLWALHYNLGIAQEKAAHLRAAAEHYHRAYDLAPHNAEIAYNYGALLVQRGETAAARDVIEGLLRSAADDGRTWLLYGNLLMAEGAGKEARAAYVRAASFPGYQGMVRLKLGQLRE